MLEIWGIEHILYLVICALILIPLMIILKKKLKDDKQIEIMFRIIGLLGLIAIILNRVSSVIEEKNAWLLIPSSFCGMTSFLTAMGLLFYGKNNNIIQAVWLIGFIGMISTFAYPDFVEDYSNMFEFGCITSFLHHTITLYALISIFVFKYVYITIKKSWLQLAFGAVYIGTGFFLIFVGKVNHAFYLFNPAVSGTELYFAAMLPIYVAVYLVIVGTIEFVRYKKKNKNENIVIENNKPEQI